MAKKQDFIAGSRKDGAAHAKTSVWSIVKTALIIFIFTVLAGACLALVNEFKNISTYQKIITVIELTAAVSLVAVFYSPIKYVFMPQKLSDKILCIGAAVIICSLEVTGLGGIVEAIFNDSKPLPKYWYLYIAGLIVIVLFFVFVKRKSLYTINQLDSMEGHQFEYACANILRANGYKNVKVTQGSGDFGVDILAEKGGIKYAIQCKCYSHKLDNTPIQEVIGGLAYYNCTKGAVMTNQYFTEPAKKLAEINDVELWDRDVLLTMTQNSKSQKDCQYKDLNAQTKESCEQTETAESCEQTEYASNEERKDSFDSTAKQYSNIEFGFYSTLLTDLEKNIDIYENYIKAVSENITNYLWANEVEVILKKIDIKYETNEVVLEYNLSGKTRISQVKKHLKNAAEFAGVKYAKYIYPNSTPCMIGIKVPLPDYLEDTSTLIYKCNKSQKDD
nr:MAG: Restriction endonuclease [Bacteriophage sp.]